jgi:hypothetical protein
MADEQAYERGYETGYAGMPMSGHEHSEAYEDGWHEGRRDRNAAIRAERVRERELFYRLGY